MESKPRTENVSGQKEIKKPKIKVENQEKVLKRMVSMKEKQVEKPVEQKKNVMDDDAKSEKEENKRPIPPAESPSKGRQFTGPEMLALATEKSVVKNQRQREFQNSPAEYAMKRQIAGQIGIEVDPRSNLMRDFEKNKELL